jgi:hypothetical protein
MTTGVGLPAAGVVLSDTAETAGGLMVAANISRQAVAGRKFVITIRDHERLF